MSSLPRKNNFFGMKEEQLIIFEQRTIPAFDMNVGKTFIVITPPQAGVKPIFSVTRKFDPRSCP